MYMFLYEIMKDTDYQLVVIDRMSKKTQFVTSVGISDLAIVSDDFRFSEEHKDNIISYVEVKGIDINLFDFEEQIKGQLLSCGKILCTNGSDWKYYDIEKYIEQNSENDIDCMWRKIDYERVKGEIDSLELIEREIAIKKSSYAYTRKDEYKLVYKREINELEAEKVKICNGLKNLLTDIHWLQNVMDTPIIDKKLYDNDNFDVMEFMKLKSELYSVLSEW